MKAAAKRTPALVASKAQVQIPPAVAALIDALPSGADDPDYPTIGEWLQPFAVTAERFAWWAERMEAEIACVRVALRDPLHHGATLEVAAREIGRLATWINAGEVVIGDPIGVPDDGDRPPQVVAGDLSDFGAAIAGRADGGAA